MAERSAARSGPGERLALVVPAAFLLGAWSTFYGPWRLPPQLPFGTVGLVVGGDVLPMAVVPLLLVRFVLREPAARYGLRFRPLAPRLAAAAAAFLALLPVTLWFALRPEARAFYPSPAFPPARQHGVGLAALWLLHHAPQLFSVELLFRGFLLQPLLRARGLGFALAVMVPWYVLLHAGKPGAELVLAGWGGVVLGVAAARSGSVLPCFLAHQAVAMTVDTVGFLAPGRGP